MYYYSAPIPYSDVLTYHTPTNQRHKYPCAILYLYKTLLYLADEDTGQKVVRNQDTLELKDTNTKREGEKQGETPSSHVWGKREDVSAGIVLST